LTNERWRAQVHSRAMEVGTEFFAVAAGVIPTLALSLFLLDVAHTSNSAEEDRVRRDAVREAGWVGQALHFGVIVVGLVTILPICFAELVALMAIVDGGGSRREATVVIAAIGFMLLNLAIIALHDIMQFLNEDPRALASLVVFGSFLLLAAGALVHMGYNIFGMGDWMFGWLDP
jgi:hypothetical protein